MTTKPPVLSGWFNQLQFGGLRTVEGWIKRDEDESAHHVAAWVRSRKPTPRSVQGGYVDTVWVDGEIAYLDDPRLAALLDVIGGWRMDVTADGTALFERPVPASRLRAHYSGGLA